MQTGEAPGSEAQLRVETVSPQASQESSKSNVQAGEGCANVVLKLPVAPGAQSNEYMDTNIPVVRVALVGFRCRARVPAYRSLIAQCAITRGFRIQVVAICPDADGASSASYCHARNLLLTEAPREHLSLAEVLADENVDVIDIDVHSFPSNSSFFNPIQFNSARTGKSGKAIITSSLLTPSIIALPVFRTTPYVTLLQQEHAAPWAVLEPWAYKPGINKIIELLNAGIIRACLID